MPFPSNKIYQSGLLYGHVEKDRVLRIVGEVWKKAIDTSNGFAVRMKGDEFLSSTLMLFYMIQKSG